MRILFLLFTLSVSLAASVSAQRVGSNTRETPVDIRTHSTMGQPGNRSAVRLNEGNKLGSATGLTTFQFSAEVISIHADMNSIEVRRKSNNSEHTLGLADNCKIKADEKQFGKKELTLEEIEPGYRVEVLLDLRSNQITQMRVKRPKA